MDGMDDKRAPLLGAQGGEWAQTAVGGDPSGRQPRTPTATTPTSAQARSPGTDMKSYMSDIGANYLLTAKQQAFYKLYPTMDHAEIDRVVRDFPRFDEAERELRCRHLGPDSAGVAGGPPSLRTAPPTLGPPKRKWLAPAAQKAQLRELQKAQPDDGQPRGLALFKRNVFLGLRTATFCLICSLPVLLPSIHVNAAYEGMVGQSVAFVVFTAYKNVGITIMQAWQGFMGTFFACFYAHALHAFMPGGAGGDYYQPALCHAANVLFIFGTLWLNMSKSMTMFMLSYHCYFMMELMNPDSTAIFNDSWSINFEAYTTTTLVTAGIGMFAGILAMLIPIPVRAAMDARKAALVSVDILITMMDDITVYFNQASASAEIHRIEQQTQHLHELLGSIQGNLDGSWWEGAWEGFGRYGRGQRMIGLLQKHLHLMRIIVPNTNALYNCVSKEDFQETHTQCMGQIEPQVSQLLTTVKDLLVAATLAAADGTIDKHEREKLNHLIADAKDANLALAQAFNTIRKWLFPSQVVTPDLQSESFFVYCLSIYSRYVAEYAEDLVEHQVPPTSPCGIAWNTIKSMLDPKILLHDKDHRSFTFRNTLSVLICYYIGFFYLDYSAIVSGTVALLISNYTGSALQKNLERLQGVAISQIFPHLMTGIIGNSCWTPRIYVQGLALVVWETLTNYIYYNSAHFGYIGMLAGAMGAPTFVYECVPENSDALAARRDEKAFELASFQKLTETAIAAVVLTFVDSVFASERASSKAIAYLQKARIRLVGGIEASFKSRTPDGRPKDSDVLNRYRDYDSILCEEDKQMKVVEVGPKAPEAIMYILDTALQLNAEADKEPRYHRQPWDVALYTALAHSKFNMRGVLSEIEHCLCGSDNLYDDILGKIDSCPAFKEVESDLLQLMDEVADLSDTVLLNETGLDQKPMVKDIIVDGCKGKMMQESMPQLIRQINQLKLQYPEVLEGSMEDDEICRINVLLMLLVTLCEEATKMITVCIKHA